MLIGALEAGGTKMVCRHRQGRRYHIGADIHPTTTTEETIPKLIGYFKDKKIEALGVAALGPVDVKTESETLRIYPGFTLSWHGGTRTLWEP